MEILIVAAAVIVTGVGTFALGEWLTRRNSDRWIREVRERMRGR